MYRLPISINGSIDRITALCGECHLEVSNVPFAAGIYNLVKYAFKAG